MQWILTKCDYEIKDNNGNCNKWPLIADMLLLVAYTILSVYNAVKALIPQSLWVKYGIVYTATNPTVSVILINFIILIRLNISLYIKSKNNRTEVLEDLRQQRKVVTELTINTWNIRMWIVAMGYVADLIIAIMCIVYGTQLTKSLSIIVVVSIMETFLNSMIDNSEIRFKATPKVYQRI